MAMKRVLFRIWGTAVRYLPVDEGMSARTRTDDETKASAVERSLERRFSEQGLKLTGYQPAGTSDGKDHHYTCTVGRPVSGGGLELLGVLWVAVHVDAS